MSQLKKFLTSIPSLQGALGQADWLVAIAAAAARLLPHPPNVTPLGALWLFAGAQAGRRRALWAIPLVALLLSDFVLGYYFVWPYVYGSYALAWALGRWGVGAEPGARRAAGGALASAVAFYAITNFGEWWHSSLYPHTGAGLVACYVAALPFFRNSLIGDLTYTGVIFGSYALLDRIHRERSLRTAR